MKKIVIIGAGPAGISAAFRLSKSKKKLLIIEKEKEVGGFSKTLKFLQNNDLYRTDIGPHRFFSKDNQITRLIKNIIKKDKILVNRHTRQLIQGKFYNYPVKPLNTFLNIGFLKSIFFILSYLNAQVKYKIFGKKIKNFEDYIIANFGKKLGNFNMLNYTEKIWGIPCKKLHSDWANQRIKGLNLISILKQAFKLTNNNPKTLIDHFYYPKFGTGQIYNNMLQVISDSGNRINTRSFPVKIIHKDGKIRKVVLNIKGKKKEVEISNLISSIPINDFLKILDPLPPKNVLQKAKKLKWRAQVYLFLMINKRQITKDNWIYIPDKKIPFARISEMKNFSKSMSPKGKTSLFIEFFVNKNDKVWNMDKEKLFKKTIKHLEDLDLVNKKDVIDYYKFNFDKVYPIYNIYYKSNLEYIKKYLDKFNNLFYIGRPGRFRYTNQDHSIEMGLLAAKGIIENKKINFDEIGNEKEYYEKGNIDS